MRFDENMKTMFGQFCLFYMAVAFHKTVIHTQTVMKLFFVSYPCGNGPPQQVYLC